MTESKSASKMVESKYGNYFLTDFREEMKIPAIATPQAYFRGASQIPGPNINMEWQLFVKPIHLEKKPHTHDVDEYLFFLGGQPPDFFSSFQPEIDFWIGEEMEYRLIDKPTVIFIPKGMPHTPLNFRKLDKPVLFSALLLGPKFTKTMEGAEYSFDGPKPGETPAIP